MSLQVDLMQETPRPNSGKEAGSERCGEQEAISGDLLEILLELPEFL